MTGYAASVLEAVKDSLEECDDSLMKLADEVPDDLWHDLGEAFQGINQAFDVLDYILAHPEDYS